MIKIIFVLHKMEEKKKSITKYVKGNMNEINETAYRTLTAFGVDKETAIDCASWAELATVGESYNLDYLDVYIDED